MDLKNANIPPDHVQLIEWYNRFSDKQYAFVDALADHLRGCVFGR